MTFQDLNLIQPILKAVGEEGYVRPTPIQEQAIPHLLEGRDLFGCAQTGTGKTAAFAVPILQELFENRVAGHGKRVIRALVMTPTRELAAQIGDSFTAYGHYTGLKNTVIFGGVSQKGQTDALRGGIDILVATPGRLLDLIGQGLLSLEHIRYFVLDEADRMLDMGFIHDVRKVVALLPAERQTMLFSATLPKEVEDLAARMMKNPVRIAVTPVSSTVEAIEQKLYFVDKHNKKNLLIELLKDPSVTSALVFTRTKHGANRLEKDLRHAGVSCDAIHGNKSQSARLQALDRFKTRAIRVLVATDIAARGIDIEELSHVFNFDLPDTPETYVHRIGRTGRAGLTGIAVSFCSAEERKLLRDIEKLLGKQVPVVEDHPYPATETEVPGRSPNVRQRSGQVLRGRGGNRSGRPAASGPERKAPFSRAPRERAASPKSPAKEPGMRPNAGKPNAGRPSAARAGTVSEGGAAKRREPGKTEPAPEKKPAYMNDLPDINDRPARRVRPRHETEETASKEGGERKKPKLPPAPLPIRKPDRGPAHAPHRFE